MTFDWDAAPRHTLEERLLASLERDGPERTLAAIIARLRALSPAERRGAAWYLAVVPAPAALDALEGWIESPVVDSWGVTATILGPEDWQMLPFLRDGAPYLDPDGENARAWRRWFGLLVLAG